MNYIIFETVSRVILHRNIHKVGKGLRMWRHFTLKTRIYSMLSTLVILTFFGGMVMVWYTFQMESILNLISGKRIQAFKTAEALETAVTSQKGFVSYFFLDGDPEWLRKLGEYRQIFRDEIQKAQELADTDTQREAINRIDHAYDAYIPVKDSMLTFYKNNDRQNVAKLHKEARTLLFSIIDLCEQFKDLQIKEIQNARINGHYQAVHLRIMAGSVIVLVLALTLILVFFLSRHILEPLRKLAVEADRSGTAPASENEIKSLSHSVRGLIEDVDHTHTELQKSRETLLQAEKMALVGKLAAGMAHSIRNPFTSVKMRLFSLGRTLKLTETQKDDLDVISQEIRHIDTIVQNFLEFSRPPRLKMQQVSPSLIVDLVIQLLEHRLMSYDVHIELKRQYPLPQILADPEQLKEVLVNLVVNACEAMKKGGHITISEEEESADTATGHFVVIRVSDDGPGIPESLLGKVLQPFFTTREEGTGLGLSIAVRIVEEHGGHLKLESVEGKGTTIIMTFPVTNIPD